MADTPEPDRSLDHWTFGRSDLQLLRQAASRTDFAIPDRLKLEALYQMARLLSRTADDGEGEPEATDRVKIAVTKTLAMFDRNDLMAVKLRLDAERLELARLKLAPPKKVQARDAWSELLRDLELEEGSGEAPGQAGEVPGEDPGAHPLE